MDSEWALEEEGEDICQCLCQRNFIVDRPKKRPKRDQNEHNEGGSLEVDALAHRGIRVRIITLAWAWVQARIRLEFFFPFFFSRLHDYTKVESSVKVSFILLLSGNARIEFAGRKK